MLSWAHRLHMLCSAKQNMCVHAHQRESLLTPSHDLRRTLLPNRSNSAACFDLWLTSDVNQNMSRAGDYVCAGPGRLGSRGGGGCQ